MVWYSHLFKNFPQFFVIHAVKGFGIVNKAKLDVFVELACFFDDPNHLWLSCKESACNAGDLGSIPGLGRSPGEGKGYSVQYLILYHKLWQKHAFWSGSPHPLL